MNREPIPFFLAAFNAALGGSPIPGEPEPPPRKELTDLDKDRIRKALEKRTRKEQKKHEQRERSAAGQRR